MFLKICKYFLVSDSLKIDGLLDHLDKNMYEIADKKTILCYDLKENNFDSKKIYLQIYHKCIIWMKGDMPHATIKLEIYFCRYGIVRIKKEEM